jgi:hypothetical protein
MLDPSNEIRSKNKILGTGGTKTRNFWELRQGTAGIMPT